MPFKIFSGDAAYPNAKYLVTPFKENGRLTAAQRHYNKKVSSVRQRVECTTGRLENRFRRLKFIVPYCFRNLSLHSCCVCSAELEPKLWW